MLKELYNSRGVGIDISSRAIETARINSKNLNLIINHKARGTWVPIKSLSQSDGGLWSVYTVDNSNKITKELVEVIYYEGKNAFVAGTLKNGDLVIKGGASKVIEGQFIK